MRGHKGTMGERGVRVTRGARVQGCEPPGETFNFCIYSNHLMREKHYSRNNVLGMVIFTGFSIGQSKGLPQG